VSTQDSWHYSCFSPDFLISTNIKCEEYGRSGDKLCYVKAFLLYAANENNSVVNNLFRPEEHKF